MANYTTLYITGFGEEKYLTQFDQHPPKFKGPEIEIINENESRTIIAEFKSQFTFEILYGLTAQMQDLSLIVDIEIEPGYCELLYKEDYKSEFKQLFEIQDIRDDDFFTNFKSDYFENFNTIEITPKIANFFTRLPTGKTYINLLGNPNYYNKPRQESKLTQEMIDIISMLPYGH